MQAGSLAVIKNAIMIVSGEIKKDPRRIPDAHALTEHIRLVVIVAGPIEQHGRTAADKRTPSHGAPLGQRQESVVMPFGIKGNTTGPVTIMTGTVHQPSHSEDIGIGLTLTANVVEVVAGAVIEHGQAGQGTGPIDIIPSAVFEARGTEQGCGLPKPHGTMNVVTRQVKKHANTEQGPNSPSPS